MLNIAVVGCGLQAATIAGFLSIFEDEYQVSNVIDVDFEFARDKIALKKVVLSENCRFFDNIDAFLDSSPEIDGLIIGSPCDTHADFACRLEPLGVPIYLEKPVATTLDQWEKLYRTFKNSNVPVQVSLPMRVCPLTMEVERIIASGEIGRIEQIVAYNDVSYGDVYYSTWYRDRERTGGMFMQKAVHDLDYLLYLLGSQPSQVCAMRAQRVFGGDKPFDLRCENCDERTECLESPYSHFNRRGNYDSVSDAREKLKKRTLCRFSKGIEIDDIGECLVECENGTHISYAQNFFARNAAHRRGARLYGYKGTLEMNFKGVIDIYSHHWEKVQRVEIKPGPLTHYGGDKELVADFLKTMKTGRRSRTDLIQDNGFSSALLCLLARESADQRKFFKLNDTLENLCLNP